MNTELTSEQISILLEDAHHENENLEMMEVSEAMESDLYSVPDSLSYSDKKNAEPENEIIEYNYMNRAFAEARDLIKSIEEDREII